MWLIIDKSTYIRVNDEYSFAFIALGVMAFAMFTDVIDGKIARKFNMVTDFGKAIDPIADKFAHAMTVIALCIATMNWLYWTVAALIFIKELTMIVQGFIIVKRDVIIPAHMIGKIASAFLSFAIFSAFFHDFWLSTHIYLDYILLSAGVILSYTAFAHYAKIIIPILLDMLKERKERKNNPKAAIIAEETPETAPEITKTTDTETDNDK
jgi:phosphatidylglycerophosphate synthase